MKFTVIRQAFEDILQRAGSFTSYKIGDIESLKGVYISAKGDGIVVHSTNITDYFRADLGGKIEKEGVVLVDFKTIFEVIRSVDDTKIVVEKENTTLSMSTKNGKVSISLLDESLFPLSIEGSEDGVKIQKEHLVPKDLSLVLFSAATDETRPVLTGVCYNFQKEKTEMVSTDGFRLSLLRYEKKEAPFIGKFVVPARSLLAVMKGFIGDTKHIEIDQKNKAILWYGEGFFIKTRMLEGEFPPYEKVLPQTGNTEVELNAKELSQMLKTTALFSREGSNVIYFSIQGDSLEVSSQKSSKGESRLKVALLKKEGVDNTISFNCKYLQAFLNEVGNVAISFEMTDPSQPGVFRIVNNENTLHIIMPIRPQE